MTAAAAEAAKRQFIEVSVKLTRVATAGAMAITALVLVAAATSWERFLAALVIQVIVVGGNIAIAHFVVPRFGPRGDVCRGVVNGLFTAFAYAWIDWPLPVWLWLPFMGVTSDQSGGNHTRGMLTSVCAIHTVAAIATGVPWIIPISATFFAGLCWTFAGARERALRGMLLVAEEQRDEISRAHDTLKQEIATRVRVELELRQAQKMQAIGRLAAGIAHELNTPIQFVGDNLQFVAEGVTGLLALREQYEAVAAAPPAEAAALLARAAADQEEADLPYLAEHVPKALALAADGCRRVATIVQSMKRFAHVGPTERAAADLNEVVETALAIARHEYIRVADIERKLEPLPRVSCNVGELNQVLLNLIVNAAHAIEDASRGAPSDDAAPPCELLGKITVSSRCTGDAVVISIGDDGCGIPPPVRERIFEPFFTTKSVGRGTGQGLSVSRAILERHGGTLTFETEAGRGTTFHLRLPLRAAAAGTPGAAASAGPPAASDPAAAGPPAAASAAPDAPAEASAAPDAPAPAAAGPAASSLAA